ncbi:MAG: hypothetical protein QOJ29_870 [Thermoleophilaceae bacterium]|nr:hypothetical protein [Thermoleophilaceae bacterium]
MRARFEPAAIAGYFRADGLRSEESAISALRRLAAPDGHFFSDGRLALAGPPTSHLHREANLVCIVDGRISNFVELGREFALEPASPAAMVGSLYRRLGRGALAHLRGSFAVVAWESESNTGFLAQDQTGRRAIYYLRQPNGNVAFASEVTTLLKLLPTRPAPDSAALTEWLAAYSVPAQSTFYAGIRRIGAAHRLDIDGAELVRRRYWMPKYERPLPGSRDEQAAALWVEVEAAVRSRLDPGDLPGVILSGGIDSSAVAAAAADVGRASGERPRGYSAVFPEDDRIDESARIAATVEALDLPGVQLRLRPSGALALALEYLADWEMPAPGPGAALEQPLVERAQEDGVNVIFDGQGGDELFGQPSFLIADRVRRGRLVSSVALAASMPRPVKGGRPSWRNIRRIWMYYGAWGALSPRIHSALRDARGRTRSLPGWLSSPGGQFDMRQPDEWAWKAYDGPRWWAQRLDLLTEGRERIGAADYLRHRAAIVGADARPPLLDVDLVEFCLRLRPEHGFDVTVQDRPLIRHALKGRVPEEVRLYRIKSDVAAFYYDTLAGPDLAPIRRLLATRHALLREYVDTEEVERLLDDLPGVGGPGWYDWVSGVWRLIAAETWLRQQEDSTFAQQTLEEPDIFPTLRDTYRTRS